MAQDQGEAVAIDIGEAVPSSVESKINALHRVLMEPESFTIRRVPAHFRQRNTQLYEPRLVSIGPYGRGDRPDLRAMEQHKWRYLQDFLHRNPHNYIKHYIAEIRELEPRARRCYFEPVELSTEKFVEMLLLDGCFILEFIMKWGQGDKDSVCTAGWSLPLVRVDLLLLENQIPLFVLEKLFELVTFTMDDQIPSLMELLVNYLASSNVERPEEEMPASPVSAAASVDGEAKVFDHLLHLYYHGYVGTPRTDPTGSTICGAILKRLMPGRILNSLLSYLRLKICRSQAPAAKKRSLNTTIPSATELEEAGVTFKRKGEKKKRNESDRPGSFLDVAFHDGVLEIPFLSVENSTLSRFTNLVAFEQCGVCKEEEAYMTSYATFMDCLIDTPADVAILHRSGILENKLASDKELAVFFNQLSDCATIDHEKHYLAGLFRDVRKYCDSRWPKWRAKLVRDYFSNPWVILSLIAAVFVLIFTFLQTFYTIFPYYHPRN